MYYSGSVSAADKAIYKNKETGPFDIIGDIHGCSHELRKLLEKLGYKISGATEDLTIKAPAERKVIFAGDLVDRGPDTPGVLKLVMKMMDSGTAFAVPGNHDEKLMRKLMGRPVKVNHGLEKSVEQLNNEDAAFKNKIQRFIANLPSYLILDKGKLVVAHAGINEIHQGNISREIREACLYGETTGEHENGLPVRVNWARNYKGKPLVVYGHTPVHEPYWLNNTVDIDTGCVFGGKLTALRYPEMEIVSVPALKEYTPAGRQFGFD
jgi:protein phosphatase